MSNKEMKSKSRFHIDMERMGRTLFIVILDIVAIVLSYCFALWLRFDFSYNEIPTVYRVNVLYFLPFIVVLSLIVYIIGKLYRSVWRFAGTTEVVRATIAYVVIAPLMALGYQVLNYSIPRSVLILGFILSYGCCVGIRLSYRLIRLLFRNLKLTNMASKGNCENIMIIGGGSAGRQLVHEYKISTHINGVVKCIIDDNPQKLKKNIEGVPIVGGRETIVDNTNKYNIDKIIVAIPAVNSIDKKNILDICKETGCRIQITPGIYEIVNGDVNISQLRDVEINDLLGREEVKVDNSQIKASIEGKVVLVTGGGGSIGSELCRQIASANPKQLIIFDIYENNAYAIEQELIKNYPELNLVTLIGSVRNTNRVNYILTKYKPYVIFHAAAHKHVPLMETSPNEAVKNNVLGTLKMATAAGENGVKRFVLISTDKAVNPTNVMGATKRICEMIVQMMNRKYDTEYVAVRFGNVLGSNGSVIPLFEKQIAAGGPVTVTDKNIIRYFMTIPEAVSLVLQAAYYAKGGEIFVLDMGDPVRIDDMARNLIKLSGFEPDVDIEIQYTGLRPGEKLYEELLMDEEGMQDTENKLIHIGKPIEMDDDKFCEQLERLRVWATDEKDDIRPLIKEVVVTYTGV
ncbi:MAG: polysaccharide biosynthesis protein [Lachnospiraceae bacterium]|nr:polysaccharide biosynthesis protein [Lachnospiraceae bacterium]